MKIVFKFFLLLLSLTASHLHSTGSYSVGDPSQDDNIDLQDLPHYIIQKCEKQARDLETEVDKFKYGPKKDSIFVPHTTLPDVTLKIDHIAEDDRNNDFFLTGLREDLESSAQALRHTDYFTVSKQGRFEFSFDANDSKSLIVFYVQTASNLSQNYITLIELRNYLQTLSKNTPESQRAIFYAFFKSRVELDRSLASIIHAMRPHILKFKESIKERDIHEKLAQVDQGLRRISSTEDQYISESMKFFQEAFSSQEVQKAWRELQK